MAAQRTATPITAKKMSFLGDTVEGMNGNGLEGYRERNPVEGSYPTREAIFARIFSISAGSSFFAFEKSRSDIEFAGMRW